MVEELRLVSQQSQLLNDLNKQGPLVPWPLKNYFTCVENRPFPESVLFVEL
jgi:hypothetical protein